MDMMEVKLDQQLAVIQQQQAEAAKTAKAEAWSTSGQDAAT